MEQAKNIFISFSFDSSNEFKEKLEEKFKNLGKTIDFSEKIDRSNLSDETIWNHLRKKIYRSSITLVIYSEDFKKGHGGKCCKESDESKSWKTKFKNEGWVYKEIKCSLKDHENNSVNGLILVVPNNLVNSFKSDLKYGELPEILKQNIKTNYIVCVDFESFRNNVYKYIDDATRNKENYKNFKIISEIE